LVLLDCTGEKSRFLVACADLPAWRHNDVDLRVHSYLKYTQFINHILTSDDGA
jgi:hypothetical protein